MSDARIDRRETRLARIERAVVRIEERLAATLPHLATKGDVARIETRLPHLVTKAELAYKPSPRWGIRAAMAAALPSRSPPVPCTH
jgi:hypothetical protein